MGSKNDTRRWELFLDESGSFDGQQPSVVVGLLVQTDGAHALDMGLRQTLQSLVCEMPWPPHATELRVPATLLAGWMRQSSVQQKSSPIASDLAALVRQLDQARDSDAVAFRDHARAGVRLRLPELQRGWDWIQYAAPREAAVLTLRSEQLVRSQQMLLRALRTHVGEDNVAVIASMGPESGEIDRYLAALETVFERVFVLLRSREGRNEEVRIHVARRNVRADVLGTIALRIADVTACVRRAEQFALYPVPKGAATDARVRLIASTVVDYRLDPPAGTVLADFVANTVGRALRKTTLGWEQLASAIEAIVGLPLTMVPSSEPRDVRLPTLVPPEPWREVRRCSFEAQSPPWTPSRPQWCNDVIAMDLAWLERVRGDKP
ncbi:MAG: hypothetical protein Q8Q09_24575 [Deltaproteobacteria bacterium]|nr:hypothetical protein [Deltaproteobacteria bacterium]